MMWAYLIHLGYRMWEDRESVKKLPRLHSIPRDRGEGLLCEKDTWTHWTNEIAKSGVNTLLIDVGEGIRLESHPELACKGSWSVEETKKELARLRSIGLTPIPKLNFSAGHDDWLGEYSRMVSTQKYYQVCTDVINEVCEIFDYPAYFHLGMDEETYAIQTTQSIAIVRMEDLWWNDMYFLIEQVEKNNARPWIWSDKVIMGDKDTFVKKMPKSVLQSIWYYDRDFTGHGDPIYSLPDAYRYFEFLDTHGFDQVPTGSNWFAYENMELIVRHCKEKLSPDKLTGYMIAPWGATVKQRTHYHLSAADLIGQARSIYYGME